MPKQRRATVSRSPAKKAKPVIRLAAAAKTVAPAKVAAKPEPPPAPPAPPRKPAFYEALALYETGVLALQRHDFEAGARNFREVIARYPTERELNERATLYLQVCERETARRPPPPKSPAESVYAATVALNAGDSSGALTHLTKALEVAPDSDHAHYIMAIALLERGDSTGAVAHLRRAITLNPENRSIARQDPDLSGIRNLDVFREVVGAPAASVRRRVRTRR